MNMTSSFCIDPFYRLKYFGFGCAGSPLLGGFHLAAASRGCSPVARTGFSLRCFSFCGARALGAATAVVAGYSSRGSWALERWLSSWGTRRFVAPGGVGSSQSRDWTRVPCIGRQTLNHWTTRKALPVFCLFVFKLTTMDTRVPNLLLALMIYHPQIMWSVHVGIKGTKGLENPSWADTCWHFVEMSHLPISLRWLAWTLK